MIFIIFKTFPDKFNSEYSAHLLEHIALSTENVEDFFDLQKYKWFTYTYYSYFELNTQKKEDLEKFFKKLNLKIKKEIFLKEKARIKDELSEENLQKEIIGKIWKYFFWKNYSYGKTKNLNLEDLENYKENYFKNALIYDEKNVKSLKNFDKNLQKLEEKYFILKKEKYVLKIFKASACSFFLISVFEKLFDFYLDFKQSQNWIYYTNQVLQGEFPKIVWLCYNQNLENILKNIEKDFIEKFTFEEIKNLKKEKISNSDIPTLIEYQAKISISDKEDLLKNLYKFYKTLF